MLRTIAGLRGVLRRTGHDRTGPWGATFPLEITEQVSGFVFAHTSGAVEHPSLDTVWLPATRAARTVHHGSPDTLAAAYDAALDMIDHQGWTPTVPVIEEYLDLDPSPTAHSSIRLSVPFVHPGWSCQPTRNPMKVTKPDTLTRLIQERLPDNWGKGSFASMMTTPSR